MAKERQIPDYKELAGLTIGQVLEKVASEVPDKDALVYEDHRVPYLEFLKNSRQVGSALLRLGLKKGDPVGVLLPNSLACVYAQFGCFFAGTPLIPMSTRFRSFEMEYMLKHSESKCLIMVDSYLGADFVDILGQVKSQLRNLEFIIIYGKNVPPYTISWQAFLDSVKEEDPVLLNEDPPGSKDIASILYTSGSTGMPKGVMTSHFAYVSGFSMVNERLLIGPDDVFIQMLPSSHIFSLLVLLNAMMGRCTSVLMETFDPEEALKLQQKEKVSILYGVPTMFNLMLSHPDFDKYDLTSNRTGYMSGSNCPVELVRDVMEKMHCNISNAFGMTEAGPVTLSAYTDDEVSKAKTSGHPLDDVEMKIVDDERRDVPQGQVGEIAFRKKSIFSGYYKQPQLTAESFDSDGFFYSGDLGLLDEEGRLVVVGRKKEMIIRGGFNVYPAEVEDQIRLIPEVELVAVIGISDEKFGEKIYARIVPKAGQSLDPEAVKAFCKQRLANYKIPDVVEIADELPLTAMGKIQKYLIKEEIEGRS